MSSQEVFILSGKTRHQLRELNNPGSFLLHAAAGAIQAAHIDTSCDYILLILLGTQG